MVKNLYLMWLAAALIAIVTSGGNAAFAQATPPSRTAPPTPATVQTLAPGSVIVSISNDYSVDLNFGPLGSGNRRGVDTAVGILTKQGTNYVGTVRATVDSNQKVFGLMPGSGCGPLTYQDTQNLLVTGRVVNGFNSLLQHVSYDTAQSTGSPSNEYLFLEFTPESRTASQPAAFDPNTNGLTVNCHDLIITPKRPSAAPPPRFDGIAFLPLNDTRWTTEGQGYIIRLPVSGVLIYYDIQPPRSVLGFKVNKSEWTIRVKRTR